MLNASDNREVLKAICAAKHLYVSASAAQACFRATIASFDLTLISSLITYRYIVMADVSE